MTKLVQQDAEEHEQDEDRGRDGCVAPARPSGGDRIPRHQEQEGDVDPDLGPEDCHDPIRPPH
jgi:hypothetical protein